MDDNSTKATDGFSPRRIASLRQRQLELAKEGRMMASARLAGMVKALRNEPSEVVFDFEGMDESA